MNKHLISFCVTHYNRWDLLKHAVETALIHPIVGEVVIVDDCSTHAMVMSGWNSTNPVKFYGNERNIGCYRNKREAISKAQNEWCVIADSDNTFEKDYFDRIESLLVAGVNPQTVYQPSFAKPHFDFTKFEGERITSGNIRYFMDKHGDTLGTCLNAMNYFVNRDEYLKVWEDRSEPWTADSILHNYNWLKAGNSICVVPGLTYGHLVHEGSHYKEHRAKTGNLYEEIIGKLNRL